MIEKLKDYHLYRRCSEGGVEVSINRIFQKYGIKRETYHGIQINGVCVRRLMAESEDIIQKKLKGCSRGYVTNENIKQVFITHAKLLHHLDAAFSCLQKFYPTCERIIEAGEFVVATMKTWRKLVLSVAPKPHIFDDHAIESM